MSVVAIGTNHLAEPKRVGILALAVSPLLAVTGTTGIGLLSTAKHGIATVVNFVALTASNALLVMFATLPADVSSVLVTL